MNGNRRTPVDESATVPFFVWRFSLCSRTNDVRSGGKCNRPLPDVAHVVLAVGLAIAVGQCAWGVVREAAASKTHVAEAQVRRMARAPRGTCPTGTDVWGSPI